MHVTSKIPSYFNLHLQSTTTLAVMNIIIRFVYKKYTIRYSDYFCTFTFLFRLLVVEKLIKMRKDYYNRFSGVSYHNGPVEA
jgi:hypothetical protein